MAVPKSIKETVPSGRTTPLSSLISLPDHPARFNSATRRAKDRIKRSLTTSSVVLFKTLTRGSKSSYIQRNTGFSTRSPDRVFTSLTVTNAVHLIASHLPLSLLQTNTEPCRRIGTTVV